MHYKTKITKVGNSSAIILPKELLEQMKLEQGDAVYMTTKNQEIAVSACDPEFARDIDTIDEIMREDRDVLNKLAQ